MNKDLAKENEELKQIAELSECRMCGKDLPRPYPTNWCWICLRTIAEKDYHRYYVYSGEFWEEVQEIAGWFAFSEKNKPKIKKATREKREILQGIASNRRVTQNV